MTMTKINKQFQQSKFQRQEIAKQTLAGIGRQKPVITVLSVRMFATTIQAEYLYDTERKFAHILRSNLEAFVTKCDNLLPAADRIDITIAQYIDENTKAVCSAYLEAGKEILS